MRELRNAIERAGLIEESDAITAASLPIRAVSDLIHTAARGHGPSMSWNRTTSGEVLRATRSNYSRAAEILGINRKTLLEKRK